MREDTFKDHVAKYWRTTELGYPVERLEWRNRNGSSNYYANYMCYWGNLVVTGDLYEAVYCMYGPEADLAFFSRCDASYLAGKIRGPSGYSSDAEVWEAEEAEKFVKGFLKNECGDVAEKFKQEFLDDAEASYACEYEWTQFLEHNEHTQKIFGDSWYEYVDAGKIRNPQIDLQVNGLRAAMKQLKDAGLPPFMDVKK